MAELVKDLICGMDIDPETAAGKSEYGGKTYYFCAVGCKTEFDADPDKFIGGGGGGEPAHAAEAAPAAAAQTGEQPAKRWWEFWKA